MCGISAKGTVGALLNGRSVREGEAGSVVEELFVALERGKGRQIQTALK